MKDKYSIKNQISKQKEDIKKAKENIKILKALKKGKQIEEKHHQIASWHDLHEGVYYLPFNEGTYTYRIKKTT